MNYLIYLAHGPAELRSEALYSLLSYFRAAPVLPAQVLIYTDAPDAFRQVLGERPDVLYPSVTEAEWQAWRGSANMVYLLKIGVLEHAAAHYPGNLLFVDTDTIWQRDPTPIFEQIGQGTRFMHDNEGLLATGNTLSRKVYRHLKGHTFRIGAYQVQVTPATLLFNSGVIGFRSHEAALLRDVMQLAEQLYATYHKHMMEQLAFSMRFAVDGPVQEAKPYVVHYWNLKAVRPTLAALFARYQSASHEELLRRLDALGLPEVHRAELAYRNLAGWQRTLRKLTGRRWRMPAFEV
ncbi:putative nucleotide-diphospho-sugar transferase [Solirubrum puertoriconensis]|uniref:Nucleotide-diphospho-sugar transferase domain-containing protein n=1 Tax=Solirubrum puertoriconensis TaxID=1751427 RepID=A0A9X0HNZ4_SOLP1|nr:putative nucleotide-diphospho-sugar transferase [Solirubrum puertoriconensis]KUG09454.1 hypothetical protein ASU33_17160 [Solirubrum puertoriconensis]